MDNLINKIKKLNQSYSYFNDMIALLIEVIKINNETELYLYRLKKDMEDLQREIFKQLEKEKDGNEFDDIVKGY